jgi:hypothetical protein
LNVVRYPSKLNLFISRFIYSKATTNVEEAFVTMTKEIMAKNLSKAPGSTKNTGAGTQFGGGKPVQ